MSSKSPIPQSDRIPLGQKIAFALGGKMDYFATGVTINILWMPYFNIGLGIRPILLGTCLMILRGWDAISDPVMGNISDNARTRWGRRRPFMFVGAIATAMVYPFLWRPPEGWSEMGVFFYLLFVGWLFFTSYTCWSMPYFGLQLELTPNYDERTHLTAWMSFFSKLVALGGGWIMAIVTGPWFADPVTGDPDIVNGVLSCSWYFAALIVAIGIMPALFVKERYYEKEASKQAKEPFWQSLRESITCKPLWFLVGSSFFLSLGNSSVVSLGQYVNIYLINNGNLASASVIDGWRYTVIVVVGIASLPILTRLSEKYDKKTLVIAMLLVAMTGQLIYYFCLDPSRPYLQLIPAAMQAGGFSAIWLFLPSMKADVADYDELGTLRRREGSLNAFYSWFIKAANTCAMGIGGFTLELSGFDVSETTQTPEVLARMTWMFLLIPVTIWMLSLGLILYYPLTRNRLADIRLRLETRRGKL
ncbi:MFS transporter [Ruficoccus sp. ZRK36]|uniref:MFS transporter n=1 Tax=Ruficoccus sp. ZRK36 TaxID=2866311 RepID=UPI001C72B6DE|nr:MFS transporter [Ruficoccus sp. ZRK36]QYY37255.1 MFS transporter [Ruficoccus sp. ZRK36]